MSSTLFFPLVVAAFAGAACGYLGSLMVMRRMSLVGDGLTHVALPGMGLALLVGINVFWGAAAILLLAAWLLWVLERRTTLPTETLVGVMFAVSLALGIIITPEPELIETLFGDIATVGAFDAIIGVVLSLTIILLTKKIYGLMLLDSISSDQAQVLNKKMPWIKLAYLLLVALAVALGVKVVGSLLMGSLVIIPAAAVKGITSKMNVYGGLSLLLGAVSAFAGVLLAPSLEMHPGPVVVLAAAVCFTVTLVIKSLQKNKI